MAWYWTWWATLHPLTWRTDMDGSAVQRPTENAAFENMHNQCVEAHYLRKKFDVRMGRKRERHTS